MDAARGLVALPEDIADALRVGDFIVRQHRVPEIFAVSQQRFGGDAANLVVIPAVGVRVLELLPRRAAVVRAGCNARLIAGIGEARPRQQRQRSGEAADDVEQALQAMLDVDFLQHAHGAGFPEQRVHHQMSTVVGSAEHDQAAVGIHHRLPGRVVALDQSARHQPAHAVRQQADRLAGIFSRRQFDSLLQFLGAFLQRLAPVVGAADDGMGFSEMVGQIAVEHLEQILNRCLLRVRIANAFQLAQRQAGDVEPDAIAAAGLVRFLAVDLDMRTHDAGDQNHHRASRVRSAHRAAAKGTPGLTVTPRGFRAFGECLELSQAARILIRQPAAQGVARRRVAEIAEVGHRGILIVEVAGAGAEPQSGVHRIGVHHQVVIIAVEQPPVAEQIGNAPAQVGQAEAIELGIAGDDGHRDAVTTVRVRMCEEGDQRRINAHGGDAGHQTRVDAPAGNFQQQPLDDAQGTGCALAEGLTGDRAAQGRRRDTDQGATAPLQQVEEVRQGGVQIFRKKARSAGRAGHAYIALDGDLAGQQRVADAAQPDAFLLRLTFESGRIVRAAGVDAVSVDHPVRNLAQAQQIANQTAARMREQADLRARGQRFEQRQGIFTWALGKSAVLETENAAGKTLPELAPRRFVFTQVGKAAHGVGAGTMDQHQHRLALRRIGQSRVACFATVAGGQQLVVPKVEAGPPGQMRFDPPHQRLGAEYGTPFIRLGLDLLAELFLRPVQRQIFRFVEQAVGRQAQHRSQLPQHIADTARTRIGIVEAGKVHLAIDHRLRLQSRNGFGQRVGTDEQRRAVFGFNRQQIRLCGVQRFGLTCRFATGRRTQGIDLLHHQPGQQRIDLADARARCRMQDAGQRQIGAGLDFT